MHYAKDSELAVNATGARHTPDGDRITSIHDHFRPSSKLFPSNGAWNTRVMASTLGVLGVIAGLFHAGSIYGGTKVRTRMHARPRPPSLGLPPPNNPPGFHCNIVASPRHRSS